MLGQSHEPRRVVRHTMPHWLLARQLGRVQVVCEGPTPYLIP